MINQCLECGWPDGWHQNSCSDSLYSNEEIEQLREQKKKAVEKAMEVVKKSGVTINPRILALKSEVNK